MNRKVLCLTTLLTICSISTATAANIRISANDAQLWQQEGQTAAPVIKADILADIISQSTSVTQEKPALSTCLPGTSATVSASGKLINCHLTTPLPGSSNSSLRATNTP